MIQAIQDVLNTAGRAIIPGIGCLSINDENQLIFNSFLKFNDGKLVQWLTQNEGLDENQALEKVNNWAKQIETQLASGSDFSLGNLGRFILEGTDEIGFSTSPATEKTTFEDDEPVEIATPPVIEEIELEVIESTPEIEEMAEEEPIQQEAIEEPIQVEIEEEPALNNQTVEDEPDVSHKEEEQKTNSPSLDDLLNKQNVTDDLDVEKTESEEVQNTVDEPIEVIINETPSNTQVEVSATNEEHNQTETHEETAPTPEITPEKKSKKTKKEVVQQGEEVTVKRKRGAFFYVNIILTILILGLGVFAFIYTDEVSQWLGISTSKTETPEKDATADEKEASIDFEGLDVEGETQIEEEIAEPENVTQPAPIEEKPQPAPPIETVNIPAVASAGDYHIIVGKFSVKENADRLVQKIRDSGYDGKILRSTSTGHTVAFHTYPSMEEAQNNLAKAKEITGTGAYIEKK